MTQGIGGVGRNVAEGVARLLDSVSSNTNIHLITALGNDGQGGIYFPICYSGFNTRLDILVQHNQKIKISMEHALRVSAHSTAVYLSFLYI